MCTAISKFDNLITISGLIFYAYTGQLFMAQNGIISALLFLSSNEGASWP